MTEKYEQKREGKIGMDFLTDNIDEDAERVRRRKEKVEKMRQEKLRQMKRRQKMKIIIPIIFLGVLGVGISLITVNTFGKKNREIAQRDNIIVQSDCLFETLLLQ